MTPHPAAPPRRTATTPTPERTMLDLLRTTIRDQHRAANDTLCACIDLCPDDVWNHPVGERAFWENVMHAVFFAHHDLTPLGDERPGPPDWTWRDACGMGYRMDPPHDEIPASDMGPPPNRMEALVWARAINPRLDEALARETESTLASPSGVERLVFPRLYLYLYSLRHVQHHAGQLCAVLRREGVDVAWFGGKPQQA